MKRRFLVVILTILLGVGFSLVPIQSVEAKSVTSGYFVDVSANPAKIYDAAGHATGESEPLNSCWYLGRTATINGQDFYQIATNEYLSSSDSFIYRNRPEVIRVETDEDVPVYDHNFVESDKVALAPGTYWYSDTVITTSEGMPFVRVAPDEYVGMWNVIQQSFTE